VKFCRYLAPGCLELLALRAEVRAGACRHCDCPSALVAHGYLQGYAGSGHAKVSRGLRFFCSNRRARPGCGRTFSILWDTVIPRCLLRTGQLVDLLQAAAAGALHAAGAASRLAISARSACRWVARWKLLAAHVRTRLCLVAAPPGKTDGLPDPLGLRHLAAAFPTDACPLAAFQRVLQVAVTG
jgi:hypothetical protein